MVLVDINPFGAVLDLYPEPNQETQQSEAAELLNFRETRTQLDQDRLIIQKGVRELVLRVLSRKGGNQYNVYQNLLVLRELFPELDFDVQAWYSGGDTRFHRQNLHLLGDDRRRLVQPSVRAHVFPDRVDGRLMISSAEMDTETSPHWQWLRRLAREGTQFYWNPGSKQVKGSLRGETLRVLSTNIRLVVLNEEERREVSAHYRPELQAQWRVCTLGEKGAEITDGERSINVPVSDLGRLAKDLYQSKKQPHPVGCGDAYMAGMIAALEFNDELSMNVAGHFASFIAGLQFQHSGSNLSWVREELLACRSEIPYDLSRGLSG